MQHGLFYLIMSIIKLTNVVLIISKHVSLYTSKNYFMLQYIYIKKKTNSDSMAKSFVK